MELRYSYMPVARPKVCMHMWTGFARSDAGSWPLTSETGLGAVIPPNDMGELKITCDVSFTNRTEVLPGLILSSPPPAPSEVHDSLALGMKSELGRVCQGILGGGSDHMRPEHCYICW